MKSPAIIQARMSSQRLPGKVLSLIKGKPMLNYLLESLKQSSSLNKIVVATSDDPSDDEIEKYCHFQKIECVRGDLKNVAKRFEKVLNKFGFSSFVRVNADSPLLDHRLVHQAVELFASGKYDLVTNVLKRTFPKGQSVEVLSATCFLRSLPLLSDPLDQEHITRYFYRHPSEFSIFNFESGGDWGSIQLAVDTATDHQKLTDILSGLQKPHWQLGWMEFLNIKKSLSA